jgi:sterol desaturase/sphingolipid hydroxylase (fatty acid hydroxylase superfamily)
MVDNGTWGARDARGEWQPDPLPQTSPIFQRPWKPLKILKYLFGFGGLLWPYNLAVALLAILVGLFFTPGLDRTSRFEIGWIAEIFARNVVLVILVSGGLHFRLYTRKGQGRKYKYSDKWLATKDPRFLFGNQTWDNVVWSLASGCFIWTAWEAITLWLYANKSIPYVDFRTHPIYSILLMIAVIYLREAHFFFIHRLIHWKPLYRVSHYLHHKNINIGPWSGLSMHPLEHLLYFSGVALHWIIPSNPVHAIFHLMHAGLTPALSHTGFHKFVGKGERGLLNDQYFHYLHHRWFTVNFGGGALPLDLWFGSFLDGSPGAVAALLAKRKKGGEA